MKPLVSIVIPIYNRSDDLVRLLDSIKKSTYEFVEIIVIDNCSTENIAPIVQSEDYTELSIIYEKLNENKMAAGGRNAGAKYAHGKYLCFIDSDNIIDKDMISTLVEALEADCKIGMVGPLMLYYKSPTRIWFAGNEINLITSRTLYWHANQNISVLKSRGIKETDHIPNLMMVRKSIYDELGGFDESYYIMYEEADFAKRVGRYGYKVTVCLDAVTYHNCYLPEEIVNNEMRKLGCDDPKRTYHFSKNRNIYIRKFAPWYGKIIYFAFFRFAFAAFYCGKALKNKRGDIALAWWKGMWYRGEGSTNEYK